MLVLTIFANSDESGGSIIPLLILPLFAVAMYFLMIRPQRRRMREQAAVQKALEKTELFDENLYLRKELEQRYGFGNIVGRSPRMSQIFRLIERVSRTSSTVLVHGESGTGKELIARAVHFSSPRSNKRFMSVNCGAMPEKNQSSHSALFARYEWSASTRGPPARVPWVRFAGMTAGAVELPIGWLTCGSIG